MCQCVFSVLQGLAKRTAPFPLMLGAAATGGSGLFADSDGQPSLMLLPTVTSELTTLHGAAHAGVNIMNFALKKTRDCGLKREIVYQNEELCIKNDEICSSWRPLRS